MRHLKYILLFSLTISLSHSCKIQDVDSNAQPINHTIWDSLLQKHVSPDGWVDYKGFQSEKERLDKYLELLQKNHPNKDNWTRDERLAYWINAYNAFTVKLILDNYPVQSIKDIKNGIPFVNTVWDIKFIKIEGEEYDLNNIEHGIIRPKFNDARIHFAVNCASVSCPTLLNEAYTAAKLNKQLDLQARKFLSDRFRNPTVEPKKLRLSKIFSWYGTDFKKEGTLIEYLNKFSEVQIEANADIEYVDYDWNLNEVANKPK